ncbi:carbohydrate ABC transporter permease [Paenibacillus camelliae]|uniref:carbohydrate ABC transporter permease n=1 Tax=Paenibacillus camelliae TaxID=512410 RepID=UPI00204230FD|nr:sugar ABC transporter permease [Paenibacillus camelliae]MCM3634253.1 sugar ABC transporter permease [Paenibacillus camelliae]
MAATSLKLKSRRRFKKEWITSYLFLLPALAFFIMFVVYPMIHGIYISFFDYSLTNFKFVGLQNFKELLQSSNFHQSVINTVVLVLVAVPVVIAFSIFVAMTIYKKKEWLRSLFRGIFYLPAVTSVVSVTVVWNWIYHPNFGILNYLTGLVGMKPMFWLGDPKTALMAITVILITTSVGQPIILYVAALGNIPISYIEAAQLDRASSGQIFTKIIWPMLMPTNLYVIVITTINTFQCFSLIQLLTSGGPLYKTSTVMYSVYEQAFTFGNFGMASAMGVMLAVIIGAISIIQFKFFGSDVEY